MKISIISMFRDSEKWIHRTFEMFETLEKRHPDINFNYFFYENDSRDNTKTLISNWIKGKNAKLKTEKLGTPKFGSVLTPLRLQLMADYRNKILDFARPLDSDYTLILDSDILFEENILELFLQESSRCDEWVLLTSNCRQNLPCLLGETEDSFYDTSCLIDTRGIGVATWWNNPFFSTKDREKFNRDEPIEVKSGFGSMGFVKSLVLNNEDVKWSSKEGKGKIEHVEWCETLSKYGKIYLVPKIKPRVEIKNRTWTSEWEREVHKRSLDFLNLSEWEQEMKSKVPSYGINSVEAPAHAEDALRRTSSIMQTIRNEMEENRDLMAPLSWSEKKERDESK